LRTGLIGHPGTKEVGTALDSGFRRIDLGVTTFFNWELSQKSLLVQTLCWYLALNPRNTDVFLRFKAHRQDKIRRVIQLCWEARFRRDFEPKSFF
jgi:hypothetical protein